MLYYIVRVIIFAVIAAAFVLLNKFRIIKLNVWNCIIAVCAVIAVMVTVSFVENSVLRFSTPQAAFNYSNIGCTVYKTIEKDDSAVIIYAHSKSSKDFALLCKDESGWLINSPGFTQENSEILNSYEITTYKLSSVKKELLVITDTDSKKEENQIKTICDNCNSEFTKIPYISDESGTSYFAIIDYPVDNYCVYVNDNKLDIRNLL